MLNSRHAHTRFAQLLETLEQLAAHRQAIEIGPGVIGLGFHPRGGLGTLGVFHPAIRIDNLLPKISVGHFVDRSFGRGVLRTNGNSQEKERAKNERDKLEGFHETISLRLRRIISRVSWVFTTSFRRSQQWSGLMGKAACRIL